MRELYLCFILSILALYSEGQTQADVSTPKENPVTAWLLPEDSNYFDTLLIRVGNLEEGVPMGRESLVYYKFRWDTNSRRPSNARLHPYPEGYRCAGQCPDKRLYLYRQ